MSAGIEPGALLPDRTARAAAPGEHEIELSKAISLKRIADALEAQQASAGAWTAHKARPDASAPVEPGTAPQP